MFDENQYQLISDWHTHTIYSDGTGTIEQNVQQAVARGLKSIAITEHGFNHFLNGVKREKIAEIRTEIERLRSIYPIEILLGIEANLISYDGDIDLTIEECKLFDVINMGLHKAVHYKKKREFFSLFLRNYFPDSAKHSEKLTQAYVRAIEKYPITTVVHLHDLKRVNVEPIARACVERGTFVELNAKRIYFNQQEIDCMRNLGVKFIINSDAHVPERVGEYSKIVQFLKAHDFPLDNIVNLHEKNSQKA